jgi:hypothetical protein
LCHRPTDEALWFGSDPSGVSQPAYQSLPSAACSPPWPNPAGSGSTVGSYRQNALALAGVGAAVIAAARTVTVSPPRTIPFIFLPSFFSRAARTNPLSHKIFRCPPAVVKAFSPTCHQDEREDAEVAR